MILFYARKRSATCSSDDRLTTGSVGVEVVFHFSDDWTAAPARIAVFRGSGQTVDVALLEDSCTVPPEVLTQPGSTLTIGVYGTDGAGTMVIPTVYAEAGRIVRGAEPSGIEPTPETQPLIDQLLAAAKAARDAAGAAERLAQSVRDAAEAGEFDGSGVWYTTSRISGGENPFVRRRDLIGREGAAVQVHDLLYAPDVGDEGEPTTLYEITSVGAACALKRLCKMQGEDGTSPTVAITEITGGHRITITDEAHPDGQSFDVMDGQGGSGTVDDDFSTTSENPVQNKVITNALNRAATQLWNLGLALDDKVNKVNGKGLSTNDFTDSDKAKLDDAASEQWVTQQGYLTSSALDGYRTAEDQDTIDRQQNAAIEAKYTKPGTGVPKTDLAAAVQTSLGRADTALQQHQDISGKLDKAQGVAHAGKFCVVGSDGNITTVSMTAWQGGSY